MNHDVFISYASQDKPIADAVCAALESAKIRCWIAPRDILSGDNWAEAIRKAIGSSQAMILIYTENSNQSNQVARELNLAVRSEVIVFPFKIDNIFPSQKLGVYLSDTHWLDAMNPPTEEHIKRLVDTVRQSLEARETSSKQTHPEPPSEKDKSLTALPDLEPSVAEKPSPVKNKKVLVMALLLFAGLLLVGGIYYYEGILFFNEVEDPSPEKEPSVEPIVVTSKADYGIGYDHENGTLRYVLEEAARPGDTVIFHPEVFPPDNPATIYIKDKIIISQGDITVDASNAGVILDGAKFRSPDIQGLIISSPRNVIMGLQFVNFGVPDWDPEDEHHYGMALLLETYMAQDNIIGGDRTKGAGPIGQANLISGSGDGISIGHEAANNIVTGNLIGTDTGGKLPHEYGGNHFGIKISFGATGNIIGPDNIIAHNVSSLIIEEEGTIENTITRNSIHSNQHNFRLVNGGNTELAAPVINSYDLENGTVQGMACPGCVVEIFSDSGGEGSIYEGTVKADNNGEFYFSAERPLEGPKITATATDLDGNTSGFSEPVPR